MSFGMFLLLKLEKEKRVDRYSKQEHNFSGKIILNFMSCGGVLPDINLKDNSRMLVIQEVNLGLNILFYTFCVIFLTYRI